MKKEPRSKDTDADAGTGADADTLTRQQTWAPRSCGVSEQEFLLTLGQSSTLSVAMAAASSCASSRVPTSQSCIKSITSPTAALKRDLEGVEAQLRGLADRWARVEAELLRITCEETFLRRQQLSVYRMASSPLNTVRMPTRSSAGLRWKLPPARRRQVFMFRDPIILCLVGLTNSNVSLFMGDTVCT